jgi:hypothetical protein
MKLVDFSRFTFFRGSRVLTIMLVLLASALVFKSCDSGETSDERSNLSDPGDQQGEDEEAESEAGAAPNETGSDVPDKTSKTVYTLKIDLESYSDTNISALRFYLAEKSGSKQTFLKELETPEGFDFTNPSVSFTNTQLVSIDDYVAAEACVTVKAVRAGIESDESEPFCIAKW